MNSSSTLMRNFFHIHLKIKNNNLRLTVSRDCRMNDEVIFERLYFKNKNSKYFLVKYKEINSSF